MKRNDLMDEVMSDQFKVEAFLEGKLSNIDDAISLLDKVSEERRKLELTAKFHLRTTMANFQTASQEVMNSGSKLSTVSQDILSLSKSAQFKDLKLAPALTTLRAKEKIDGCISALIDLRTLWADLSSAEQNVANRTPEAASSLKSVEKSAAKLADHVRVPQVAEAIKKKTQIFSWARKEVLYDFSLFCNDKFSRGLSVLSCDCQIAEVLGPETVKELQLQTVDLVLSPLFSRFNAIPTKVLESISLRISSFETIWQDFSRKFGPIFPKYWGVDCYLLLEFCSRTAESIRGVPTADPAILPSLMRVTTSFEEESHKKIHAEFDQYAKSAEYKDIENRIKELPNVRGSISNEFERFNGKIVDAGGREIKSKMIEELKKDLALKEKTNFSNAKLEILDSVIRFFSRTKVELDKLVNIGRNSHSVHFFASFKENVNYVLESIKQQIQREENVLSIEQKEPRFHKNMLFLFNSITFIKSNLPVISSTAQRVVGNLAKVDTYLEEEMAARVQLEIFL